MQEQIFGFCRNMKTISSFTYHNFVQIDFFVIDLYPIQYSYIFKRFKILKNNFWHAYGRMKLNKIICSLNDSFGF